MKIICLMSQHLHSLPMCMWYLHLDNVFIDFPFKNFLFARDFNYEKRRYEVFTSCFFRNVSNLFVTVDALKNWKYFGFFPITAEQWAVRTKVSTHRSTECNSLLDSFDISAVVLECRFFIQDICVHSKRRETEHHGGLMMWHPKNISTVMSIR